MKRKLLALVLVIAMMIGIMPIAKADPPWFHARCDACNSADITRNDEYSSFPYDSLVHYWVSTYETICNECGDRRYEHTEEEQAHDYFFGTDENVCSICGYRDFACVHSNVNKISPSTRVPSAAEVPFEYIDKKRHLRRTESVDCYCMDCGKFIMTYHEGSYELHSFENGDTCVCGYPKPATDGDCQHVGVSTKIDTEYRNTGNTTTHQKRDVYGYTCSNCSETIIERYTEWTSENHKDSGDGWCLLCGAVIGASQNKGDVTEGTCTHSAVEGSTVYVKTYFEAEDASTHKAIADDYEYTCSKCHESFVETKQRSEDAVEKGIPHAWGSDGVCLSDGCGYGCTHTVYSYEWQGYGKSEKIDDEKHRYTFPAICTCTTCGATWNEEKSTEGTHSMTEKTEYKTLNSTFHLEKKYRACSDNCGMEVWEDVTRAEHMPDSERSIVKTEYEDGGNTHYVNQVTYGVCACGMDMGIVDVEYGDISGHVDSNKDGICDLCEGEYVDTTVHDDVEEVIYDKFGDAETAARVIDILKEADPMGRDMYLAALDKIYAIYIIHSETGTSGYNSLSGLNEVTFYVRPNDSEIYFNETLMHEVGHAIDDIAMPIGTATRYFMDGDGNTLYDVMKSEFTKYLRTLCTEVYSECDEDDIDAIVKHYMSNSSPTFMTDKNINDEATDILKKRMLEDVDIEDSDEFHAMIAEIMGRFTATSIGVHPHPEDYYKGLTFNTVEKEVWAEYYAYRMTNNTEALAQFEKLFPASAGMLDDFYCDIYEAMFE